MQTGEGCLSVAGLDPCAGAGILADIKTFESLGVMGFGIATAITYQNEDEFDGLKWLDWETIENQLTPLLRRYSVSVVKVGLVNGLDVLLKLCQHLKAYKHDIRIIWDPVLSASAGHVFHQSFNKAQLMQILPMLELVTPNRSETAYLSKVLGFNGTEAYERDNYKGTGTNFLFKSTSSSNGNMTDLLLLKDGREFIYENEKLTGKEKHGTGCVMSSAIAAELAKGNTLEAACQIAKDHVHLLMRSTDSKLGINPKQFSLNLL